MIKSKKIYNQSDNLLKKKLSQLLYNEEFNGEKSANIFTLIELVVACSFAIVNVFCTNSFIKTNSFVNFIGLFTWFTYHIVLFFLLKRNIYNRFMKYITVIINVTGISFILTGYSVNSGLRHSLSTFTIVCYCVAIVLSGFYQKPHVSIFTGFLVAFQFSLLFCFAAFSTDTPMGSHETFKEYIVKWDILFCQNFLFICLSVIVAYLSKRIKKLLEHSLHSEADAIIKQQAKEAIEEASRQKTAFFINLAHEIKTPVTLILNYLDSFIKNHGISHELKIMKHNLSKLSRYLVNFIDIEKLEQGKIFYNHDQVVNLKEILNYKLDMFIVIARKKNLVFKYKNIDNDLFIKIDPFAIDRIFNNIIDNAIRYTKPDGQVSVLLDASDNEIKFIVKDTGAGISDEHKKHIFDRFYQISQEKRNLQGIGMGLNIVKSIIDEVKADIEINSELNNGTEFIITFKRHPVLNDNEIITALDYSKPIVNLNKIKLEEEEYIECRKNIFVVEDNREMLVYIIDNLKLTYNVFYAENGKEALVKLKRIPLPDLVISDIMMDEMDGYEFYEKFYENDSHAGIPFIFLTAITDSNKKIEAIKKGAIDFISKPFLIDILVNKVESIIRKQVELENKIKQYLVNKAAEFLNNDVIQSRKDYNDKNTRFISKCKKFKITKREKDIILLIFDGLQHDEISFELSISKYTVQEHVSNIYRKCEVQNKIELYKLFNQ